MEIMIPLLIAGAVVFFIVLVLWSAVRVAGLSGTAERVEQLDRELDRLRERLGTLEKRSVQPAAAEQARDAAPPVAVAERSELHIRPVRPAPVIAPVVPPPPPRPAAPVVAPRFVAPLQAAPTVAPASAVAANAVRATAMASSQVDTAAKAETSGVKRAVSLEERLGQSWLNKLGIVALVTGVALLLGYQLRNLGPLGKSVTGFVLSTAILATDLVLERKERYRIFARAVIGGGWALLFFVTFALFHVPAMQVLHSQGTDLGLMLTVAAGMVAHSLKYRSQVVTSLAFLLGFVTVAISHVTVFSLVAGAILATGLLAVAFRQRWFALALGGLIAVYVNHGLWLYRLLPEGASPGHPFAEFLPSALLLLFYWLIFRLFFIFRVPESDGDRVCSTLHVLLNSAGLLALLKYQSAHPEWAFHGLLALGAAELVLAFVARRRHHRAFVALGCIGSLLLLAAVPFRFADASWSMAWLLESEMLFVCGLALRERVFRRLGILSAMAAAGQLLVAGVVPIFNLRQSAPDTDHHLATGLALGCSALAAWFNAEYAARRWADLIGEEVERIALRVLSYAATLCAALALWIVLAGPWTLLPWLGLALVLAFVSGRVRSADLAQQADLLNVAVVARAALTNFAHWEGFANCPRTLILGVAVALLYANMGRRQAAHALTEDFIEPAYAWAATGVLSVLAWYALQPAAVALAWCAMGVVLLEIGIAKRRTFLRHQAFVLLGASFVRMYFINIGLAPVPRMYTLLALAALFAWSYERLRGHEQCGPTERAASCVPAWFALATVVTLMYFGLRPESLADGLAGLAVAMLLLARVLRRPLFSGQAITLMLLAAGRAIAFNILSAEPLGAGFRESRMFTTGLACALLLAGLPIAFSVRRQWQSETGMDGSWRAAMRRPEQVLFFAPLAVLAAWVPVQFHGGSITVAWSVLGLCTFLFALAVGERSFRLSGLGLLLTGVGKIVFVDIWHASPKDRYITLIVMGAALLFVSFLYSRYRETILELL